MERDFYWTDLLTILTEDDNLRMRKNDFDKLKGTDICEFLMMLKTFEARLEERKNNLETQRNGKSKT